MTTTVSWPPPEEDPELLRNLVERMRRVPSLEVEERVSSGPGASPPPMTITLSGERYVELAPYRAGEAVDVRPLPNGRPGISFAMPGSRLWFEVELDHAGRVVGERIVSPGHEIVRHIRYP